jgi:hypothetical protein
MVEEPPGPWPGDEVLVDCSAYGVAGKHWCRVTYTNYWSAAVYPVKVEIPGRGEGQFKVSELAGVRTPEPVAQVMQQLEVIGRPMDRTKEGFRWRRTGSVGTG